MDMKKVINGKKYDTETAKKIGEDSGFWSSSFRYYNEELYQKSNGEFFLAGEGGPMTKYGVQIDSNTKGSGSKITPLTDEEAKEWVERVCSYDTYCELFGEPEE